MARARTAASVRDGFIVEPAFIEGAELEAVRAACDALLATPGSALGDRALGGITRQIMMPSAEQAELRSGSVRERIAELAATLLDAEAQLDLDAAVAAPLMAGGLTAHGYGTPHFTPPNRSADRDRRAWILSYVRRT
ncbi:MAG: hypothetical protein V2J24_00715 [Pseudomonadales bacterium]|jgi:hypothetical protein|nr:hypothetical protein [Pseudomonadales bacterium]